MRHPALYLSLIAGAALVTACSQGDGQKAADRTEDAVAGPVGQMSAATMGANMPSAYVSSAAMGDMYEIHAADMALERGQSDQVKELARMIKADHTAASAALQKAVSATQETFEIPTELDERRKGLLQNLGSAPAGDFDRVYLEQQVAAHEEAVTLHGGFSDNTDETGLANHARTVLPKIEAHLKQAKELLAQTGTDR